MSSNCTKLTVEHASNVKLSLLLEFEYCSSSTVIRILFPDECALCCDDQQRQQQLTMFLGKAVNEGSDIQCRKLVYFHICHRYVFKLSLF